MGSSKKQTLGYWYRMGLHFGLCHGPVDAFTELRGGDRTAWAGKVESSGRITVNAPELWGGEKKEGGISGELDVMMGEPSQPVNDYLAANIAGPMPAFRGMLSAVFRGGRVGAMNPYPKPWKFKVRRIKKGWHKDLVWYPGKAEIPLFGGESGGSKKVAAEVMITIDQIPNTDPEWAARVNSIRQALYSFKAWVEQNDAEFSINVFAYGSSVPAWAYGRSQDSGGIDGSIQMFEDVVAPGVPIVEPFYGKYADIALGLTRSLLDQEIYAGGIMERRELTFVLAGENLLDMEYVGWLIDSLGRDFRAIGIGGAWNLAGIDTTGNPVAVMSSGNPSVLIGELSDFLGQFDTGQAAGPYEAGMNPAHIVYEALTNPEWGLGYPSAMIDNASFTAAADTFHAEGLGLCLQWVRQDTVEGFIQDVMNHAGAVLVQDPRTALFRITPIRGGYSVAALPEIRRGLNVVAVESFERAATTETVNEITVQYTDVTTGKAGSVTVQHLANIQAQGGIAAQTVRYPGAPTAAIAQRLALRDLEARATPLCKVRLSCDRTAYGLLPGDVVRWSDDKLGITDMPCRVLQVNYGTLTSGVITIQMAEDVFGLPATSYLAPETIGWVEPDITPKPSPDCVALEAPYAALARDIGAQEASALDPMAGFIAMAALRPPGTSGGFELHTAVGAGPYSQAGSGTWAPTGLLVDPVGLADTVIALSDTYALNQLEPGDMAMIGDGADAEIVRVDSVAASAVTVARGCADTVAKAWPAGTRLWGVEAAANDATEYADGETVSAKPLTESGGGLLPEYLAPTRSVTMASRASRPYPPGLLEIGGDPEPATVSGAFVVTWAHRDRLLQADQLLGQEEASIGPERTTRYALRLLDAGGSPLVERLDIAGETATVDLAHTGDVTLQLYAISDNGESWQRHVRTFAYTAGAATVSEIDADPYTPEDGTVIIDGGEVGP